MAAEKPKKGRKSIRAATPPLRGGGRHIWDKFLETVFCNDKELIEYVQMICGLAAIGQVKMEALFIAYGGGRNGKSTFWNSIGHALGDYFGKISPQALAANQFSSGNIGAEMANLQGKRLCIASESREGSRLNEAAVKQITSTDDTVEEYCEKWLVMQSVHVRATTLTDYTSKVRGYIDTKKRVNGVLIGANRDYSCEVVSPILQYEDMDDLQEIVRLLRQAGAIANSSCGIHVHVDGKGHTPESLIRLMGFAIGRQDLFYEALDIGDRAGRWCKKMNRDLLKAMQKDTEKTRDSLERIWYSAVNDGYQGGIDHQHYNSSRYHGINLHAFFTKGTVEFRLFNGTTHAGKIKAYVQFCLAMSAWAIECPNERLFFKGCKNYTADQKYTLMTNVLTNRLGLRGKEFKTCRQHLTSVFQPQAEAAAA